MASTTSGRTSVATSAAGPGPEPATVPAGEPAARPALVERLAVWSARHPWTVVGSWLLAVVAAVVVGGALPGTSTHTTDPGEAGRGERVLNAQATDPPDQENILVRARSGSPALLADPALRAAITDLAGALRAIPGTAVRSPLDPAGRELVSAAGTSGLVTVELSGTSAQRGDAYDQVRSAVGAAGERHPAAELLQAGDRSVAAATDQIYQRDLHRAELLSLPLTLLILVVVFGALVAAGIPVVSSLLAVVATFGLLRVVKHWLPVNSTVFSVVLLIGMAVGVDYSLFYLRRYREERVAGRDADGALRTAARTSGRAVMVSGLTVLCCLSGLFLTGLDVFRGMAIGTILVVGLAVAGSMTLLPALLAVLGRGTDAGRVPWLGRRRVRVERSSVWAAVAGTAVRRPVLTATAAALALLFLALPAAGMRLRDPTLTQDLPTSDPTVAAVQQIQAAFPGGPAPAEVVIWGDGLDRPAVTQALAGLHAQVAASGGALGEPVQVHRVDQVLVASVPLAGTGADTASAHALDVLRSQALPATLGRVEGIHWAVTGSTAGPHDFAAVLRGHTPLVFGVVLALAFVLLLLAFRSVTVPLVSIALTLVSIGAAYGVVVLVFQHGAVGSALGLRPYGAVITWLPLFMFVVLFALSMDYHIFILSRIRERWAGGVPARQAIVEGTATSAGVVTSAAVIMVAVFSIFTLLSALEYKMLGVGMSAAILIDATLVRGVLLPALLALLGDRAWLGRRPRPVGPQA